MLLRRLTDSHQNHRLIRRDFDELLIRVKEAYQAYSEIAKQLQEALQSDYNEDDLEYLTYQLNEIDEADIKENELQELEVQKRISGMIR